MVRRELASTIQASVRAGESVTRVAERILSKAPPAVEMPKYATELAEAAKFPRAAGDPNLVDEAVKKWSAQIKRLGQGANRQVGDFTIRSSTQQLVRDLERAKPEQVDKLVDRWVVDKARYQARVVARNETVEAFRKANLAGLEGQEWAPGVKWSLSPSHPRPDICDVLAGQDLHRLGPGCYPVNAVPARHVSCLCFTTTLVDADHFKRKLAALRGQPEPPKPWETPRVENGNQWLRKQPGDAQEAIAGPTRAKLLRRGRSVMEEHGGAFKPVWKLLGEDAPPQRTTKAVDASRAVAADRAKMVRPFPELAAE